MIGRPIVARLGGSLALHNNNNDHERDHDAQSATGRNGSDLPGFETRRPVHRHRVAVDDDDASIGVNGCLAFSVCRVGNAGRCGSAFVRRASESRLTRHIRKNTRNTVTAVVASNASAHKLVRRHCGGAWHKSRHVRAAAGCRRGGNGNFFALTCRRLVTLVGVVAKAVGQANTALLPVRTDGARTRRRRQSRWRRRGSCRRGWQWSRRWCWSEREERLLLAARVFDEKDFATFKVRAVDTAVIARATAHPRALAIRRFWRNTRKFGHDTHRIGPIRGERRVLHVEAVVACEVVLARFAPGQAVAMLCFVHRTRRIDKSKERRGEKDHSWRRVRKTKKRKASQKAMKTFVKIYKVVSSISIINNQCSMFNFIFDLACQQ